MRRPIASSKFTFHALVEKDPDVGTYSSVCLENSVASMGDTPTEALHNLKEAVQLYLDTIFERGHEEMFFRPAPKEDWIKFLSKQKKAPKRHIDVQLLTS